MHRYLVFLVIIILISCKKEEEVRNFTLQISSAWNKLYADDQKLFSVEFIGTYEGDLVVAYILEDSYDRVVERRDRATGEVLWQLSEMIDMPFPAIIGDKLFIPSAQENYYLLDLDDGSVESITPFKNNSSNHFYSLYYNNSIHAVIANLNNQDGPLLLRYRLDADKTDTLADFRAFGTGNGEYIIRQFTALEEKVFVMVEREVNSQKEIVLFHIDPTSNTTEDLLEFEPGNSFGQWSWLSIFDEKLIVGGGTKMHLLNASQPFSMEWSNDFGPYKSTRGQRIRIGDRVVFDWGLEFGSIDLKSGELLWTIENNYLHPHKIGKVQDKLLYLSSPEFDALQNIYIMNVHDPKTNRILFSYKQNGQPFWIEDFTATDQTLYVMTDRQIKALEFTKP